MEQTIAPRQAFGPSRPETSGPAYRLSAPQNPPAQAASRHCQIPRALLYSSEHSSLAVAAWCLYESLGHRAEGRYPANARRCWVAERFGTTEPTLDRARRELLEHGSWLKRVIRGKKRSALHTALGRPQETRRPYAAVPAWSLNWIHAGVGRPDGKVSPDAWRTYAVLCDRLAPTGHDLTIAKLSEWLGVSSGTARRRLHELEEAGMAVVGRTPGMWMHVRAVLDEPSTCEATPSAWSEPHAYEHVRSDPIRFLEAT
ncbi:hypothetical protein ACOZ38_25675 [Sphaerisporangium viridialbum]|uniref:hypothetical protein n=1 Tax=Sphaerisporangium viridialbum TaxID=46189 RepID=UPI003C7830C3